MYTPVLATILDWTVILGFTSLTLIVIWQIMIRNQ